MGSVGRQLRPRRSSTVRVEETVEVQRPEASGGRVVFHTPSIAISSGEYAGNRRSSMRCRFARDRAPTRLSSMRSNSPTTSSRADDRQPKQTACSVSSRIGCSVCSPPEGQREGASRLGDGLWPSLCDDCDPVALGYQSSPDLLPEMRRACAWLDERLCRSVEPSSLPGSYGSWDG